MAIIMNQVEQVITLQTKRSTYQMKVGGLRSSASSLLRRQGGTVRWITSSQKDVGFSGNPYDAGKTEPFSLDTLPQEFPSYG